MSRRSKACLLGCLLAAIALAGGCQYPTSPTGVGTKMPRLSAEGWLNGPAPTASDLSGKVVVLEFFATWCGPCHQITPELVQTYHAYQDREVVFIALTTETAGAVESIREFIRQYDVPWPVGYGASATSQALGVRAIPTTFVFARDASLVWHNHQGGSLPDAIEMALLAEG